MGLITVRSTLILVALASAALAGTQGVERARPMNPVTSTPKVVPKSQRGIHEFHLAINLGSFRMIEGYGKFDLAFSGGVMISQLKGTVTPIGNIRREYSDKLRQAFSGEGRIVVEGDFRAIQWFGKNGRLNFNGNAETVRMYAEFDKNLNTGTFWYGPGSPRQYLSPYGRETTVPQQFTGSDVTPIERGKIRP